jgi:hypothetical protein
MFYRCQRFTTNQYKVKRKGSKERSKENRRLPWSGAPGRISPNSSASGFWKMPSAIIHRTVWCSTGLSSVPTEQRLARQRSTAKVNSADCAQRQSRRQKAHRTVNRTCPVHHRTVRCTTGLSGGPVVRSSNGRTLTVG